MAVKLLLFKFGLTKVWSNEQFLFKKNEQGWFFEFEQSGPIGRLLRLDHGTLLVD